MALDSYRDIEAFLAVARERSFARAAAQLGVSASALSHTVRALEARLGLRLLARTTRSVSTTEAGERLIQRVGPRLEAIHAELAAFAALRDRPAGMVRIAASDFAAKTVLWPKLSRLLSSCPDVRVEMAVAAGLTDIVAERFDAGVRFGDQVAKDMTAVRISPDIRMAIVGSPAYLDGRSLPAAPSDLTAHACITTRLSRRGSVEAWALSKGRRKVQVRVDGPWILDGIYPALDAALAGFGLAYVPQVLAQDHIEQGRLACVLDDWCPTLPGLHIFFASRRPPSPALSLVVEALRHRA